MVATRTPVLWARRHTRDTASRFCLRSVLVRPPDRSDSWCRSGSIRRDTRRGAVPVLAPVWTISTSCLFADSLRQGCTRYPKYQLKPTNKEKEREERTSNTPQQFTKARPSSGTEPRQKKVQPTVRSVNARLTHVSIQTSCFFRELGGLERNGRALIQIKRTPSICVRRAAPRACRTGTHAPLLLADETHRACTVVGWGCPFSARGAPYRFVARFSRILLPNQVNGFGGHGAMPGGELAQVDHRLAGRDDCGLAISDGNWF